MNSKNAFNVDLQCLDSIKDYVKMQKTDKKWVRTGEAIDAAAKVYGFRVDNVHSETYRMLNGMNRNVHAGEQELELIGEENEDEDEGGADGAKDSAERKQKRVRKLVFNEAGGQKTLEKEANLNMASFNTQHEVDPLFRKTTQKFDEMGLSTLMSSTLSVTASLLMQLDSSMSHISKKEHEEMSRYSGEPDEGPMPEATERTIAFPQNVDLNPVL